MDTHINIESDKELQTAERHSVSNEGKIIQPSPHTHVHAQRNQQVYTTVHSALLLQPSVIVPDVAPSLMVTDSHLHNSSHLFIYLFICVCFIY